MGKKRYTGLLLQYICFFASNLVVSSVTKLQAKKQMHY